MHTTKLAIAVSLLAAVSLALGDAPLPAEAPPAVLPAAEDSAMTHQAVNQPTYEALERPLARFSAEKVPLQKVLGDFADIAHVNLAIDWPAIERAGIRRDLPLTLNLERVPARRVLKAILGAAGRDGNELAFLVDDNQAIVSLQDELRSPRYQMLKVYDVGFAFADSGFGSPEADAIADGMLIFLRDSIAPESWRDNGGLGTCRIFRGQLIVTQPIDIQESVENVVSLLRRNEARSIRAYDVRDLVKDDVPVPPYNHTKMDGLIDAIETTCGRDTWRDRGGKTSSIAAFEGKIFVTANPAVQQQIEGLLALMRKKD